MVHASSLQHPDVAALLAAYSCRPVTLAQQLRSVLLRGIEAYEQIHPGAVIGHLSTTDWERFALAQQSGVTVWQLTFSNGTQLLYLQALHAPWSLLAAVSTQQADGSRG